MNENNIIDFILGLFTTNEMPKDDIHRAIDAMFQLALTILSLPCLKYTLMIKNTAKIIFFHQNHNFPRKYLAVPFFCRTFALAIKTMVDHPVGATVSPMAP